MSLLRTRRAAAAVAAAMTTVLLAAEPASAAVALGDNATVTGSNPETYAFSTTRRVWAAVGVRSNPGSDHDLTIRDANGRLLSWSLDFAPVVDFVAINSTVAPLAAYQAVVSRYSGAGSYDIHLAQGHGTIRSDIVTGMSAGGSRRPLGIADIELKKDQKLALFVDKVVHADGTIGARPGDFGFFLMAPGAGTVLNRTQAMAPALSLETGNQWCKRYVAPKAGRYAIVMTNNRTDNRPLLRIDPTGAGDTTTCPG
ncbi:hypothetical protein [Spirilliplanes yamanashiensis]|uniref:Secreted protein n=1 Tax=Spirilliplanes yamanashiensis TaxID=42233 RepID=A0A8J3YAM5_9ACTN|nr:hypothetical protein [Spirilliplanes yamanashiensis]MDP9816077.1 hypothetical protein [Spirilliplanes yamanashiensis]GIJ04337.1 hypothetical protein Sya03_36890 [Spirilliplanes yamanashiensis]